LSHPTLLALLSYLCFWNQTFCVIKYQHKTFITMQLINSKFLVSLQTYITSNIFISPFAPKGLHILSPKLLNIIHQLSWYRLILFGIFNL
jgi:hypothetical protein